MPYVASATSCFLQSKLCFIKCWKKGFQENIKGCKQCSSENNFVQYYQKRPFFLEHLSLIETTRYFTFDSEHKKDPWKPRDVHAIVQVWPQFYSIPSEGSEEFETFCWT